MLFGIIHARATKELAAVVVNPLDVIVVVCPVLNVPIAPIGVVVRAPVNLEITAAM